MSIGHSTVYRKSGPTAKAYRRGALQTWTEDIKAADSPGLGRRMLDEKEAALQLLHPARQAPGNKFPPTQVKPSKNTPHEPPTGNKLPPKQAEAVKKATVTGSYAHGLSMAATLKMVGAHPNLTSKAKFLALILASHFPTIRPSMSRLQMLTGYSTNSVQRGLAELKARALITWKRGRAHQANMYTCNWLEPPR